MTSGALLQQNSSLVMHVIQLAKSTNLHEYSNSMATQRQLLQVYVDAPLMQPSVLAGNRTSCHDTSAQVCASMQTERLARSERPQRRSSRRYACTDRQRPIIQANRTLVFPSSNRAKSWTVRRVLKVEWAKGKTTEERDGPGRQSLLYYVKLAPRNESTARCVGTCYALPDLLLSPSLYPYSIS